jgi:hypothetical protein
LAATISDAAHPSGGSVEKNRLEPMAGSVQNIQAGGMIARRLDQHP